MPWQTPVQGAASFVAQRSFTFPVANGNIPAAFNIQTFVLQPGTNYLLEISLGAAAAYADSVAITLNWVSDLSSSPVVLDGQTYYVMGGSTAFPHVLRIQGPAVTSIVEIGFHAGYNTALPTVAYSLYQGIGAAAFPAHTAKSAYSFGTQPGYPVVGAPTLVDTTANIVNHFTAIGATTFIEFAMPFWNGPWGYSGNTSSGLTDSSVEVGLTALTNFGGAITLVPQMRRDSQSASGLYNGSFTCTNVQGTCVVRNFNAAAKNFSVNFQMAPFGGDSIGSIG